MDFDRIVPGLQLTSVSGVSVEISTAVPETGGESFESVLSNMEGHATPTKVSGGPEQPDFHEMRRELSEKIRDAVFNGDPNGELAQLQQEFTRVNEEARRVAASAFDQALARLSAPEDPAFALKIKMGRFAGENLHTKTGTAKLSEPSRVNVALPPQSPEPHTERPDEVP